MKPTKAALDAAAVSRATGLPLDLRPATTSEPAKTTLRDLVARVAATLAVDWLAATNPDARAQCQGELDALQAAIETEGKIAANAESADEMKHLLDVLRRGRDVGSATPAAAMRAPESAEGPAATPAKAPVKKKYKKGGRKTR